jgi:hypothetical protein
MPYLTPQERRRQQAAARRALYANRADTVAAMDQITALYPDPRTRPAGAAEVHDQLAGDLNRKET